MKLIERILFYPILIVATMLAFGALSRFGASPLAFGCLAWVAALWLLVFMRSMLWVVRTLFWLTALGLGAASLYFALFIAGVR